MISLTRHILERQPFDSEQTGELSVMMTHIARCGKLIARDLNQAGLLGTLGMTGTTNVHGEQVHKLDERANQTFVDVFEESDMVRVMISEEMEKPLAIKRAQASGTYAVFLDPLDGSSNVDVNAPLGSIFSIHRLNAAGTFLKRGREQVAGGYLLYGASTILVYTCGDGVYQLTLDPAVGEFFLSGSQMHIPPRGKICSVNTGNQSKWREEMRKTVDAFQMDDDETGPPYTSRYSGCLAADVHRILWKGGLYLYPGEVKKPAGKLRLMYEAAPLSFVVEQAGGLGSTGEERISSIQPNAPHQCVPFIIGSREDVEIVERRLKERSRSPKPSGGAGGNADSSL